jgi:hypothetical protein
MIFKALKQVQQNPRLLPKTLEQNYICCFLAEFIQKVFSRNGVLQDRAPSDDDGRVDGGRAEELERLVDEYGRHREDDEEDEGDAQSLRGPML